MTRRIARSSAAKSIFSAAVFVVALALSGCGADTIMGPEQSEGPAVNTSSQPHDSQPSNDDCSVGGC